MTDNVVRLRVVNSLSQSSAPFTPIQRYHDERMINYDSDRGVSVKNDAEGSTLILENASGVADSGNYTCSPYNIRPSWVVVHVLSKGNSAAAVQVSQHSLRNAACSLLEFMI